MPRSLDARIRALSKVLGWSLTVLKDQRGRVVQVHTLTLLDAFLRVQLYRADLALDPDLTAFLATYQVKQSDGAMIGVLRDAARRIRFPNEFKDEVVVAPQQMSDKDDELVVESTDAQDEIKGEPPAVYTPGPGIPVAKTRSTRSRVDALGRRS